MIYLIPVFIVVGTLIYIKLSADQDVKKQMEEDQFWQRQDYADKVIEKCFNQIESE